MRRRRGVWAIDTSTAGLGDADLEAHIVWLLDHLEPSAPALIALMETDGLVADVFCGYFMADGNCGFSVQPSTLARIAAFNASLGFDLYAPD